MPAGGLLDPLPAAVQCVTGQGDDVERIHHRDGLRDLFRSGWLKPVNPSIATVSIRVAEALFLLVEPGLEHLLERPGTMSSSLEAPVPSRARVRSIIMVYVGHRLWCGTDRRWSTPRTRTPSNWAGSLIRSSEPASRTASFTVCQAVPRFSATRAIDIRSMTTLLSAQKTALRDSFVRDAGSGCGVLGRRHTVQQSGSGSDAL